MRIVGNHLFDRNCSVIAIRQGVYREYTGNTKDVRRAEYLSLSFMAASD